MPPEVLNHVQFAALPSPTLATDQRHVRDIHLREAGFRIVSRPKGSERDSIWTRNGFEYNYGEAMAVVAREKLRKAKELKTGGTQSVRRTK